VVEMTVLRQVLGQGSMASGHFLYSY